MKTRVTKAVIPAAGFGTRFLPATKAQPKEMLPIVDTPTIQYVVEEAVAAGITDILIITGRDKRSIEDHFDRNLELERRLASAGKTTLLRSMRRISEMAHIHYVRQSEQLGLGHAILQARCHVDNEPFAVLLGDTIIHAAQPCVGQLMKVYERFGGPVVGLEKVALEKVSRYGIISGSRLAPRVYRLTDLVEKPEPARAPSRLAIGGRYILTAEIFNYLERARPGKNGEIQLTDALLAQAQVMPVYGHHFEGIRYDIGDRVDYLITQVEYALRRDDLRRRFEPYLKQRMRELGKASSRRSRT